MTSPHQLLWSESVMELRQGSRWLVVPPGRVIWSPRRFAVWAVHGGHSLNRLSVSLATADRLPRHATAYVASEVLTPLLPLVSRQNAPHPRRALDEQVIVDECHRSVRHDHGLFVDGFSPGLGWGTTLGIATPSGIIAKHKAASRTLEAARDAALRCDWLVRVRLALILKAHEHAESVIREALDLFTSRNLDLVLQDEFH